MQKHLRWCMIDLIGMNRMHKGQLISHPCQVGKQFGEGVATLTVSRKFPRRARQCRGLADESKISILGNFRWTGLIVSFDQFRLVGVKVQVRGRADHVQIDNSLGSRCMMQSNGRLEVIIQQRTQSQGTQAKSTLPEEMSALHYVSANKGARLRFSLYKSFHASLTRPPPHSARPRSRFWMRPAALHSVRAKSSALAASVGAKYTNET